MKDQAPVQHIKGKLQEAYKDYLHKAEAIFLQGRKTKQKMADQTVMFGEEA